MLFGLLQGTLDILVLHRLEKSGLLRAEWGRSESSRRAKFYSLTTKGPRVLRQQTDTWHRTAGALFKVLGPRKGSSSANPRTVSGTSGAVESPDRRSDRRRVP